MIAYGVIKNNGLLYSAEPCKSLVFLQLLETQLCVYYIIYNIVFTPMDTKKRPAFLPGAFVLIGEKCGVYENANHGCCEPPFSVRSHSKR